MPDGCPDPASCKRARVPGEDDCFLSVSVPKQCSQQEIRRRQQLLARWTAQREQAPGPDASAPPLVETGGRGTYRAGAPVSILTPLSRRITDQISLLINRPKTMRLANRATAPG